MTDRPQVECDHAGAVCRRTYDPRLHCPVCWKVKLWAEWIRLLKEFDDVDGFNP